jgi:hypothetical protein
MAFIDIQTLDATPLIVAAGSVYRITLSTPVLTGGALARIDVGNEHQATRTGPRELEQALTAAGATFVEPVAPDGTTPVFLSVAAISAVRPAIRRSSMSVRVWPNTRSIAVTASLGSTRGMTISVEADFWVF